MRLFRLRPILADADYPLPDIGPPWYTPDLQRELLKKVQLVFGFEPTGLYDQKLYNKVSEAQKQLGLPITGIVDNIMLNLIGVEQAESDPGWPETQAPPEEEQPTTAAGYPVFFRI